MIPSEKDLRQDVLNILSQSDVKITPQVLLKNIRSQFMLSSREAKKVLRDLVADQELCYNQIYGTTYIEKSFLKPVRVTRHFVLTPPGFHPPNEHCHTLVIGPGIAFGSGQHPTTQLCLEAIDRCFYKKKLLDRSESMIGADVGTGSGVLALSMVKAGLGSCRAFEIDPVSVNEVKKNVALNNLNGRIEIIDDFIPESPDTYDIMCANLRYPTLMSLSRLFASSLKRDGVLILSGVREWETKDLISNYSAMGIDCIWQDNEKQWSAVMLRYTH